jgi:hypothetical protein
MPEPPDVLPCPLCEGRGELRRVEVIERLTHRELKAQIDAYLSEVLGPEGGELVSAGGQGRSERDFEKEVHSWNPQLPIWRRSPKE